MLGSDKRGEGKASAAAVTEVAVSAGVPANRIQLFAMGRHVARDGRGPWVLADLAHAQEVVAATRARLGNTDFMIDYDHQADSAPRTGGRAIAAGWVKPEDIVATEDGIWAQNVHWTATAATHLEHREYRYISPWFGFDKQTGRITRLFNAALVNTPALELAAVAAQSPGDEHIMSMTAIAGALALAEDATEDQILAAIQTMKDGIAAAGTVGTAAASALGLAEDASAEDVAAAATQAKTVASGVAAIATALGLEEGADVDAVAAAAAEAKAAASIDPSQYVPAAQYQTLIARVAKIDEERATAAVDQAVKDGKLAPAARDWGVELFKKDEQAFASFINVSPAIIRAGEEERTTDAPPGNGTLTDEEKAICATIGCSEADYLKTKKDLA